MMDFLVGVIYFGSIIIICAIGNHILDEDLKEDEEE